MAASFHFSTTKKFSTSPFLLGGFKPHSFTFPITICVKPKLVKINLKPISASSNYFHSKEYQEKFFKTVERCKKAISENPLYQSMIEEEEILKTKLQQIDKEKLNLEEQLQNLKIKKDDFFSETVIQTFAVAIMIGDFGNMKIRHWEGSVTDGLSETISKLREKVVADEEEELKMEEETKTEEEPDAEEFEEEETKTEESAVEESEEEEEE
ncbi:hypothetical protein P8452_56014 [Trifolium repens]|nr:hypothetical protein P8452_56014 [Trifolium repens]